MSSWYNKNEEEIVQRLKITLESEDLKFIGKFSCVEDKDYGFFKDVRSVSGVKKYYPTNEGKPDDFNIRPLEVWTKKTILFNFGKKNIILEDDRWYKFYAAPAHSQLREKIRNPFLLQTDLSKAVEIEVFNANELIENIQQDSIKTPESVKGKLTRSIEAISNEINTQPATFIFELIQNADDYPNDEKYVKMLFDIKSPYLIIKHNGSQFDVNNAVAICDINEGDKRGAVEKIGFKGIGFKSIFKDCNFAYLKSGNFSFRFDEIKWRNEGRKLFWQITPINTDERDYASLLLPYENVNLVIKPREPKQLSNYKNTLLEHFKDERILLFLRNVRKIDFKLNNDSFSISNTDSKWRILKSKDIRVEDKICEELNRGIALNDKRIPLKYQGIEKTEIGFGFLVNENIVQYLDNATIYAYLPTNVNLGFGFLLNGNFIPDGSRTHLHKDLIWNDFLFEVAGQHFPNKLSELVENSFEPSSVIKLIPDFNKLLDVNDDEKIQFIKAFKGGFDKNITNVKFLPTEVGSLETLSNILIDETGITDLLGSEFHQLTGLQELLISSEVGDGIPKIKYLIQEYRVGIIYGTAELKNDITTKYQTWLKTPTNNYNFINYLYSRMYLDIFRDEPIYLSKDGLLYKGADLFFNLGEDATSLEWLCFKKVLHSSVRSNLFDFRPPLLQYEPITFINDIICKEKKSEIIEGLCNGSIAFYDFYSYLSKYVAHPLFPATEIKSFPLQTKQVILPSWSFPIYFNSNSLSTLLLNNTLPSGLFYLLDDYWDIATSPNLNELALKLGVILFEVTEPFNFVQRILINNNIKINRYYLSDPILTIQPNSDLWSFIISVFNNLSDPQKDSISPILKSFPVLSKNAGFKALHNLYLPSEFTDNNALETLALQFVHSNIDFVSADYLKNPMIDKSEIKTLFKRLEVKFDTKDFLIHTLLPNLSKVSVDLFVPVTRLIYDNRESDQIIQLVLKNYHFRLKTIEGSFKPISECYLGSPYIEESRIPNPLSTIPIVNQVSAEYANSHLEAWHRFFSEKLKVTELVSEYEILSNKLRYLVANIELCKDTQASVSLLFEIYQLNKSGSLPFTSAVLNYLQKIPLLCKQSGVNNFHRPKSIHFSSVFKPTFDFEEIFGLDCGVLFLSEVYKFDDSKELILFFQELGVTEVFEPNRHSVLCQTIPTADGQKKPAFQLFKYEHIKYVGLSNVSFRDLSIYAFNGRTLEDYLGFKPQLITGSILNYIRENQPNRRELKELISNLLKVFHPQNDTKQISNFISSGKLLSSARTYNSILNLHSIDESIRSGIRENEYLIDPLFSRNEQERDQYLKLFNIKNIEIEDFNPEFDNPTSDIEFTNRLNERIVFLAFDSDHDRYLDIENELKAKFRLWNINRCSRISLKYPEFNSIIVKEDIKTFEVIKGKYIYYIGSWTDPRVNPVLVDCLSKNILGLTKHRTFIQDMLLNDPNQIILDFESKGRSVPDEIQQRFLKNYLPQQVDNISSSNITDTPIQETEIEDPYNELDDNPFKDITPEDEKFIIGIIKGIFELNKNIDANTTAKIKTLMAIKDKYNAVDISDEGRILKAGSDEIIVRSAQNGLLYLDVYHWSRLAESNVSLSIYTNRQIKIFKTQEELINHTQLLNKFGIVRMPNDYTIDDYNSLDKISNKGKWHYIFIVNESTKAAKSYKEVMDYSDPDLFKEDNF